MRTLWFVIPAHGRFRLAEICLRQLAHTCDELKLQGVRASAVVIADDENLEIAKAMGFGTVERDNRWLGRRWNDGYQAAASEGVEFVVPLGSDDWVMTSAFAASTLPADNEIRCHRMTAVVSERGDKLAVLNVNYDGGDGVRVIPLELMKPWGYRPSDDDKPRAVDTSVLMNLQSAGSKNRAKVVYTEHHPLQVVDFKTQGQQLNTYTMCLDYQVGAEYDDPWSALAGFFPRASIEQMRGYYSGAKV